MYSEATYIDTDGIVHIFEHRTDQLGDFYVWRDITGFQHAFLRNMTMSFDLWVAEVIQGINIAKELI